MKSKVTNYLIYGLIGLMIGVFYFTNHIPKEKVDYLKILSDSALIPGIILLCVYCLTLVSKEGIFDGIGYGTRYIINKLIPTKKMFETKTYLDYKLEKEEKRKETHYEGLIVSIVFIVICIICYLIYKVA